MSAAAHLPTFNSHVRRGMPRDVSNEIIMDAARILMADGIYPTATLIARTVTCFNVSTINAYLKDLRKRGLIPQAKGSGLEYPAKARAGTSANRRGKHMPGTHIEFSSAAPCGKCGSTGGYRQRGRENAARYTLRGFDKKVCRDCKFETEREDAEAERVILDFNRADDQLKQRRISKIREENRFAVPLLSSDGLPERRLTVALAEERAVWAEQAQRRLTGAGEHLVETPREGAEKARAVYWRVWRRLGMKTA